MMTIRGLWLVAAACLGSLLPGCASSKGGLDQPCNQQPGASFGAVSYSCNAGLVCNDGLPTPTCENPNAGGAGIRCGSDQNCAAGLFCAPAVGGAVCSAELTEGAPCPSGVGCAAGLTCNKLPDGSTVCAAGDDGGTPGVSEAGADAKSGEGGSASDASPDEQ